MCEAPMCRMPAEAVTARLRQARTFAPDGAKKRRFRRLGCHLR